MPDARVTGPSAQNSGDETCANISEPWFVVYAKPLRERQTLHRIREEGHIAWLPLEAPPKHRKVERERLNRPLFPRYLFVTAYPWLVVRDAGGQELGQVLTSPTTRKPLVLPAGLVDGLMAQCGPGGVFHPPEPREVRRKDMVRVEEGPFSQFSGIVQRTTRERVWILLNLFGRASEVPFTRDQVELVG